MPPRVVSLALAGRKLTAPPEAYGPKKQQQIKGWLKAVPTSSFDLKPEPEAQDLKVNDAALEELYKEVDRRESIDGSLRPLIDGTIKVTDSPGQRHSAAASSSTTASNLAQPGQGGGGGGAASPPPNPAASAGELSLTSPTRPAEAQPSPYPNATPQRLPKPGTPQTPRPPSPSLPARPYSGSPLHSVGLDFAFEGVGRADEHAALELDASLLMARVEGSQGPGGSEAERVKRALMLALLDKKRFQDAVQAELAEVRAQAAAAQQEAAQKLDAARADLLVSEKRALGAEAELSRLRTEAMRVQQDLKTQTLEVHDKQDEYKEQIAKLQSEAQAMMSRLKEQGLGLEATVKKALDEADAARQQAGRAERQRRQQQHESELLKARLEMELANSRAELLQRSAELARAERDRQAALQGREKEAAARLLAEESEKRALQAAVKQLELSESHLQARSANEALRQHVSLAAQRSALLRAADPVAAAALAAAPQANGAKRGAASGRLKHEAAPPAPEETGAGPRARAGSPPPRRAGSPPRRAASPNKVARAAAVASVDPEAYMLQQQRVEQHTALQRALAAEMGQLTEAVRLQRRALLAAQLGEAKHLEEALGAAPEHLRCMGVAFRGYLLGDLKAGSPGAGLAAALSSRYRLFMDPVLQGPGLPDALPSGSSHLVRLCASLVVFAAPGLLAHPLARAAVAEAAAHGCPVHIVAPAALDSLAALTGEAAAGGAAGAKGAAAAGAGPAQQGEQQAEARAGEHGAAVLPELAAAWLSAAWEARLVGSGDQAQVSEALARRLGLPDKALRGLPAEALRRMAVDKTGCMPDLAHLNSPRLTTLRVVLAATAGAGAGPGVGGGGGGEGEAGGQAGAQPQRPGVSLENLVAALRGNKTITALSVQGCTSPDQARQLAQALAASPVSAVSSLTLGSELPLGPLLGRGRGGAVVAALDLSRAAAFGPEDAVALVVALGGAGAAALAELTLPAVLSPRFRGAAAGGGPEALRQLVQALAALPGLRRINGVDLSGLAARMADGTLDLSGAVLGPVAAGVVFARIRALAAAGGGGAAAGVRGLNLTGCEVGVEGAEQLPGLAQTLQQACLADNALGAAGTAAVCRALGPAGPALAVLDLSINNLEDAGVKELAQHLPQMPNLSVLALTNNSIKSNGAKALAAALPALQQLQALHLSGNLLGDSGVTAMEAALGALPCLRQLHLQSNYSIAGDGARALAAVLTASTSLEELHLGKNSVGPDGARQLAQGLAACARLRHLGLGSCRLRMEGVQHLAGALALNTSLTSLCLDRNSVGDRGVKVLVEALERNSSLQSLELQVNSISLVGCRLLSTLLRERNATLSRLAVGGNDADDVVLQALEELATLQRQPTRASRLVFPSSRLSAAPGPGPGPGSRPGPEPQPATPRQSSAGQGQGQERGAGGAGGDTQPHASRAPAAASMSDPRGGGGRAVPGGRPGSGPSGVSVAAAAEAVLQGAGAGAGKLAPRDSPAGGGAEEPDDDLEQLLDRYRRPAENGGVEREADDGYGPQTARPAFLGYGYTGM